MGAVTRKSRRAGSCCMASMIVSVAVLMMSIGRITVQANSLLKDYEIEAYLNRVNKPAVKSFVLDNVDIFDCVDIHNQPAFDHPLLKDHKIITAPSFFPKTAKIANASRLRLGLEPNLQNGEDCPDGTVPIRRMQKSDLIHVESLNGYGRRDAVPGYEMAERAGAVVRSGGDSYVGARAYVNLWGVPEVEDNSWSHAVVEVSDDSQSFIEGGWLVNPSLYGDKRTRIYGYWTADGYHNTGCYNSLCPGFVQVSKKYVLGMPIADTSLSVYDGTQFDIQITIYKDEEKKAWWLVMQDEPIGYWPISIFTNNFVEASLVKLVGAVLNTNNGGQHTTTDMGNGHFSDEGYRKTAYISGVQVMKDPKKGFYSPAVTLFQDFSDQAFCYNAFLDVDDYNVIYYGGPGLGADKC